MNEKGRGKNEFDDILTVGREFDEDMKEWENANKFEKERQIDETDWSDWWNWMELMGLGGRNEILGRTDFNDKREYPENWQKQNKEHLVNRK